MSRYGPTQNTIEDLKRRAELRNEIEDPARSRFYKVSMLTSLTALILSIATLLRK